MYRYALRQSASVPRFLYPAKGYGIISLTLKLVCRKYPQKDEFRTKKILNQEFLYEISSFCTLSENNSLLHGNISCFCIFLAKNGVFNTNRTPRVADSNSPQWAMLSYLSICKKGILTYAFQTVDKAPSQEGAFLVSWLQKLCTYKHIRSSENAVFTGLFTTFLV